MAWDAAGRVAPLGLAGYRHALALGALLAPRQIGGVCHGLLMARPSAWPSPLDDAREPFIDLVVGQRRLALRPVEAAQQGERRVGRQPAVPTSRPASLRIAHHGARPRARHRRCAPSNRTGRRLPCRRTEPPCLAISRSASGALPPAAGRWPTRSADRSCAGWARSTM